MKKFFSILIILICVITVAHTTHAATFTVDSLLNTEDVALNGVCNDGDGNCTLRAAITEAENVAGEDTIVLGVSGTTVSGVTAYSHITEDLIITGSGQDFIIDATDGTPFNISATVDLSYFSVINFPTTVFGVDTDNNVFSHITLTGVTGNIAGAIEVSGNHNTFSYLTISSVGLGIRIMGDYNVFSDSVSHDNAHSGMTTYDGDYNQFLRNHVYNIGDRGMFNIFGSSHTIIQDNIIEDCGQDGLVIGEISTNDGATNSDLTITGNTFSGNTWSGIGISELTNATISNNIFTGNGQDGIIFDGSGAAVIAGTITINDNTISTNGGAGIRVKQTAVDFTIDGNTITNNTQDGIGMESNISGTATISNNTISGNRYGISGWSDFTDSTITGNTITYITNNSGIYLEGSSAITIGGPLLADRNIIYSSANDGTGSAIELKKDNISNVYAHTITIQNNYLDVDATGMIEYLTSNSVSVATDGDLLDRYTNISLVDNLLGGSVRISNTDGVTIQGNTSGLAADGETLFIASNAIVSVIFSQNVIIGGIISGQENIIVGDGFDQGLQIADSTLVEIYGNRIGFLADGITPAGSFLSNGMNIQSTTHITIGGATSAHANVIGAGDPSSTASLFLQQVDSGVIQGNFIGVGLDSTTKHASNIGILNISSGDVEITSNVITGSSIGVYILASSILGGFKINDNTIFDAGYYGVLVGGSVLIDDANPTSYATILGNSIYGSGEYGIAFGYDSDGDLLPNDVTTYLVNDTGDSDTGHNDYMNHPIIISATQSGLDTVVSYALDVPVSANPYRVEFFTNPTAGLHTSGYGEGEVYKTYVNKTISSSGQQVFSTTLNNVTATEGIAATITECLDSECTTFGATSRFSKWDDAIIPSASPTPSRSRVSGTDVRFIKKTNTVITETVTTVENILGSGTCPANLIIHDNMKQGDRDGKYSVYHKNISREVKLLQAHINRILKAEYNQASGPEDGIFGKLTKQGVMRLQVALNKIVQPVKPLVIDGIVGPFTREAINHSCG